MSISKLVVNEFLSRTAPFTFTSMMENFVALPVYLTDKTSRTGFGAIVIFLSRTGLLTAVTVKLKMADAVPVHPFCVTCTVYSPEVVGV